MQPLCCRRVCQPWCAGTMRQRAASVEQQHFTVKSGVWLVGVCSRAVEMHVEVQYLPGQTEYSGV